MMEPRNYLINMILDYLKSNPLSSSKDIYTGIQLQNGQSYATLKRSIQQLVKENLVNSIGQGKATKYKISEAYELIYPIDSDDYFHKEIDEREIRDCFNFELIRQTLKIAPLFTKEEEAYLDKLQSQYISNISNLSEPEYKKELERLTIDLSWKSSQIEGNTYSLLETEHLLKDKEEAKGKTKEEAIMLLNHKEALDFIIANPNYISPLSISAIEDIHSILINGLDVDRNIRRFRVGISGTNYRPLDNEYQIKEALMDMSDLINNQDNVFDAALLILVLISYIQPFADGNKRTARVISNAIFINNNYCPISFRTVDSIDYKKAMLIFYEQNNISAFKKIFIEQFEFAVKTYF